MQKKVLIVDDDPLNLDIMQEILDGLFELIVATNGEDALTMVEDEEPDVVLMDIMMPGINGYEACRRIKSGPNGDLTQVILVSAKASTAERLEGYKAGADDYLIKPFDDDELLAKVRVQFRLRRVLLELSQARDLVQEDNDVLEGLVAQRTVEVTATRDLLVFAMAKLTDSRDPETGEHLERMRRYCKVIAEELSISGPYSDTIDHHFVDHIYRSSPLHDVGKVGIPDAILLKPGRLNDAEFQIMKRHAAIGADALQQVSDEAVQGGFLDMAVQIARSHHERFDGTGYPDALDGPAIPLAARIVALADVFDALTSVRVYKSAFDPIVARTMIEEEIGKHFDPAVVDAFHLRFDELLRIRDDMREVNDGDLKAAG